LKIEVEYYRLDRGVGELSLVLAADITGDGLNDIAGLAPGTAYCCGLASEKSAGVTLGAAKVGDVAVA
jgi:hypothetical protein